MEKIEGYIFTAKEYQPYFSFWESLVVGEHSAFCFEEHREITHGAKRSQSRSSLSRESLGHITRLVGDQEAGVFLIFSSLVSVLLHKYTGEPRVILDTPLYKAATKGKLYADNVSLVFDIDPAASLRQHLGQCQERIRSIYKYQNFPVGLLNNSGGQPVFQTNIAVCFSSLHYPLKNRETYDLVLDVTKDAEGYAITFEYTQRFSEAFIAGMPGHLNRIVQALGNLDVALADVTIIDDAERRRLVDDFNNTDTPLPAGPTLKTIFEQQVSLTPSAPALISGNSVLTYEQVNQEANRVAHYLRTEYRVGRDDLVGIITARNERMIIAMLGVLKAGAAFLPIDPTFPKSRKEFTLNDAGVNVLLTESEYLFDLDQYGGAIMALDIPQESPDEAMLNPADNVDSRDLAYVIYTSGSTGSPKGVMIEHLGAVNMCLDQIRKFGIVTTDKVLQLASCSFDASISEIFKTLFAGATLVMVEQAVLKEPKRLFEFIRQHSISVVTFPPSFLASVDLGELKCLRVIISAGEAAKVETAMACVPWVNYFNAYGPTECTVCVSIQSVNEFVATHAGEELHSVPIGKPIANTKVYLLDAQHNLVPQGVAGEICVSGIGLSRGYRNNEALTRERFVDNPFAPGTKLYKTGDLGRWLPGGELEYLGRKDHQVKIRGHRVELGEIQHVIEALPEIKRAYVLAHDNKQREKTIVAYFSARTETDASILTKKLQAVLPHFMIPAYIVQVDDFPLNKQGKINHKLLYNPLEGHVRNDYVAPETPLQQQFAGIWEKALGQNRIGIHDEFFALGGDSIKAIRIIGEINRQLKTDLEVKDIFNHPDIARLVTYYTLQGGRSEESIALATVAVEQIKQTIVSDPTLATRLPEGWEDLYPASDIQIGMLYHNLRDADAGVFHDQMFHQLNDATFDFTIFRRAVEKLVQKHEMLRTSFDFRSFPQTMQIVHAPGRCAMDIVFEDITSFDRTVQKEYLQRYLLDDIRQPFTIETPGLWRIRVFQLAADEVGILFVFHHAIIDGWSDNSFITELSNVYFKSKREASFVPAPLTASYKDYVIDQLRQKQSDEVKHFWRNELVHFDGVQLPFNRAVIPGRKLQKSVTKTFFVSSAVTRQLAAYTQEHTLPVKHVLLACFLMLIRKTTNNRNVCVGMVSNGRPDKTDGDKLLGCFLNTVPFLYGFDDTLSLHDFLKHIHEKCVALKAFDKLSLPEILKLAQHQSVAHNHMVDVSFNYVDFYITKEMSPEVKASEPLINGSGNNPAPFAFSIKKVNDMIRVSVVFHENLFTQIEIDSLCRYYQNILGYISKGRDVTLRDIQMLDQPEVEQILATGSGRDVRDDSENLIDAFEAMVAKYPSEPAVIAGDVSLTYHELNIRVNQLAHYLIHRLKVVAEDRIAILQERDENFSIAILAVLKTGAGVIPLSTDMPEARIQNIIEDAAVSAVLTGGRLPLTLMAEPVINLDEVIQDIQQCSDTNPGNVISGDRLAYIMYTSGSTGVPKGVVVTHRNIRNTVNDQIGLFSITKRDRVIQLAAHTFDVAMYETFMALNAGAALVMVSKDYINEPRKFEAYLNQKEVSILAVTPGYLNLLNRDALSVRVLITGGEPPKMDDALACGRRMDYYNSFGPTECGVCIATYKLDTELDGNRKSLPVGKPLSNTTIVIADPMMQVAPSGVAGEITVKGYGVARGYLNNPELTAERFVSTPFEPEGRFYRTGDLAFWNTEGNLEFVGRNDAQLKVNGYRIEPREIEGVLRKHPEVSDALVVLRKTDSGNTLDAYIVSNKQEVEGLHRFLQKMLPLYMIPTSIATLEAFPLNDHGKIDLKALRDYIPVPLVSSGITNPVNELETELLQLWTEVLGIENISTNASFFEIGGNSLTLVRVFNKLSVNYPDLRIADLFAHPTISALASLLAIGQEVEADPAIADGFNV